MTFNRFAFLLPILFDAPGEGGGGGGAGGEGDPPAPYRPEGLGDHLVGDTDKHTIDKLLGAYSGAREAIGKFGSVPKEAGEYNFEFSDAAKPFVGQGEDVDAAMGVIRNALHANGITDKQTGVVNSMLEGFAEAGVLQAPVDPNETLKSLAPADFKGSDAEAIQAAEQRIGDAETWIDKHAEKHKLGDEFATELKVLTATPAGMAALDHFRNVLGHQGTGGGGGGGGKEVTAKTLEARTADPRNQFGTAEYDDAFATETMRMHQEFYSEG